MAPRAFVLLPFLFATSAGAAASIVRQDVYGGGGDADVAAFAVGAAGGVVREGVEQKLSPQELMTCPGTPIAKTECMTMEQYDAIQQDIHDVMVSLGTDCDEKTCPQATWAGCVLRMAGHDFMDFDPETGTGGSDGCTDMDDPDNAGLAQCLHEGKFPTWHGASINSVYAKHCQTVSLADFLVLAAEGIMVATRANVLADKPEAPGLEFKHNFRFGRTTLSGSQCTSKPGVLPDPAGSCAEVKRSFIGRLGLDAKGAAALMGVHTLGRAFAENSGYDGWWMESTHARKFDNKYFNDMLVFGWIPQKSRGGKMQWIRADMEAPLEPNAMMLDTDLCLAFANKDGTDLFAAEEHCCAWTHSKAADAAIRFNNDRFCGLDCTVEGQCDNGGKEMQACCDHAGLIMESAQGKSCGDAFKPTGFAYDEVLQFAADERAWLKYFKIAWKKVTEQGFGDALRPLGQCAAQAPVSSASKQMVFQGTEPLLEVAASFDGYVESHEDSRDKGFFTNAHLVTAAHDRQAFIRFDLPQDSGLIASMGKVRKAEVVLKQLKDNCLLSAEDEQFHELREANAPWTLSLTYDTRPSLGAEALAQWSPQGAGTVVLDVTSHVQSKNLAAPLLFAVRTDVDKWCSYGASNSDKNSPSLWPVLRLWFEDSMMVPAETTGVPDFSFVGYHHGVGEVPASNVQSGWKVFDVDGFSTGGKSAEPAIRAAVSAAEAYVAGGGSGAVLKFSAKTYTINTGSDSGEPIAVRKSNIVWKGAGSGHGGTTIYMETPMAKADPNVMSSTPFKILFGKAGNPAVEILAKVTGSHKAESTSITVDDASGLNAGMWVTLKASITDKTSPVYQQLLQGMAVRPSWADLQRRLRIHEHHQIDSIDGSTVKLKAPLHVSVDAVIGGAWELAKFDPIEEVGVEDIKFQGNWAHDFHHHLSSKHDGGISMLKFSQVGNSYVKNCVFDSVNRALELKNAAASSVMFTTIQGRRGHTAVSLIYSSHNFVGFSKDIAGQWHSFGLSHHSAGNVFHRVKWAGNTGPEFQARQPYANLYDNAEGGWAANHNGGAQANHPNHLAKLVMWNTKLVKLDDDLSKDRDQGFPLFFDKDGEQGFCTDDEESSMGCIVHPIIKGWYGAVFKDNAAPAGASPSSEGFGWPVTPPSLYESQLQARDGAGGDSSWLKVAAQAWVDSETAALA